MCPTSLTLCLMAGINVLLGKALSDEGGLVPTASKHGIMCPAFGLVQPSQGRNTPSSAGFVCAGSITGGCRFSRPIVEKNQESFKAFSINYFGT